MLPIMIVKNCIPVPCFYLLKEVVYLGKEILFDIDNIYLLLKKDFKNIKILWGNLYIKIININIRCITDFTLIIFT